MSTPELHFKWFEQDIIDPSKSQRRKICVTIDAYEAFMRLKATPIELAKLFSSSGGVDYRGCSKKLLATNYVANEYGLREKFPFTKLVEKYGTR
jgi:hypothetical protein